MSHTQELFINKSLQFENRTINENIIVPISDAKFGILSLKAISAPISTDYHEFVFMIDCSASMSDDCSDNKTKLHHIIHTLKNMMLYFKENIAIKNYVTIHSFDDKIYNILDRCTINDTNFNEVISKIEQIMPQGTTNIELALKDLKKITESIKTDYPDHNICAIFMTDGDATSGNMDINFLAQLVDHTFTNAFIGFGVNHDATLLNTISSGNNSAYYFIDELENSGYVYGEILHDSVYKLLKNVQITIENGLIYDFKNNVWVDSLSIGEIVSEANKIYHICSNNIDVCAATITANNASDEFIIVVTSEDSYEDLTKYAYRQRTLQHLFSVKDFFKKKSLDKEMNNLIFKRMNNHICEKIKEDQIQIHKNLEDFMNEMKKYMTENNLVEDKIMKNLCDDIYICYQTFGTKFGDMYVSARQTSQGTQRCYTVSYTPIDAANDNDDDSFDLIGGVKPPLLKRQKTISNINNFNSPSPLLHNVYKFSDSPYLTPTSAKIMREISGNREICDSDEENDSQMV